MGVIGPLGRWITPRFRSINNVNALFFDKTNSLETFIFQQVSNPVPSRLPS